MIAAVYTCIAEAAEQREIKCMRNAIILAQCKEKLLNLNLFLITRKYIKRRI